MRCAPGSTGISADEIVLPMELQEEGCTGPPYTHPSTWARGRLRSAEREELPAEVNVTASQPDMVLMLHKLRSAHIRWRAYAYGIISGLKVTEIQAPVDHRLCTFGEWYHGPGERHFGRFASFAKLDEAHKLLHLVYAEIYKGVLLGGQENPEQKERFGNASRYLLDTLDSLESEVTRTRTDHGRKAGE